MMKVILSILLLFLSPAVFRTYGENIGITRLQHSAGGPYPSLQIVNRWQLPDILREISGLCYISENRFACVQDELGSIFIYNTSTGKIEKKFRFPAPVITKALLLPVMMHT